MPTANTAATISACDGWFESAIPASPNENTELRELRADEEPAAVDDVGEQAAERRQEQQRPELREEHEADVDTTSR